MTFVGVSQVIGFALTCRIRIVVSVPHPRVSSTQRRPGFIGHRAHATRCDEESDTGRYDRNKPADPIAAASDPIAAASPGPS